MFGNLLNEKVFKDTTFLHNKKCFLSVKKNIWAFFLGMKAAVGSMIMGEKTVYTAETCRLRYIIKLNVIKTGWKRRCIWKNFKKNYFMYLCLNVSNCIYVAPDFLIEKMSHGYELWYNRIYFAQHDNMFLSALQICQF